MAVDEIARRARAWRSPLAGVAGLRRRVIDGVSTIGGGSAPGAELPTRLVAISGDGLSASALDARLRAGDSEQQAPGQHAEVEHDRERDQHAGHREARPPGDGPARARRSCTS